MAESSELQQAHNRPSRKGRTVRVEVETGLKISRSSFCRRIRLVSRGRASLALAMQVVEQQIDVTLPSNAVRMLIAQPFLEFQPPVQEPFALTPACVQRLQDAIDHTFVKVAAYHPRFVLFPEFSVPGLAGVQRIRQHLASS